MKRLKGRRTYAPAGLFYKESDMIFKWYNNHGVPVASIADHPVSWRKRQFLHEYESDNIGAIRTDIHGVVYKTPTAWSARYNYKDGTYLLRTRLTEEEAKAWLLTIARMERSSG